jgi:hypothetical protein
MSGTSADTREGDRPKIHLQDVWDWAFCPLRVWWRKHGSRKDRWPSGIVSGESLVRRSVSTALQVYYRISRGDTGKATSPSRALGFVWRGWMEGWGIGEEVIRDLLEYQERRREVLDRIEGAEDGSGSRGGGCTRPMWTREWREQASASGLLEMRAHVDKQAGAVGILQLPISGAERERGPMRFADAFATSVDIIQRIKDLPSPDDVFGTQLPVTADLLSSRLICVADIVIDAGKSNARGRPRKDASGPRQRQNLIYELHLFELDLPLPFSIERDIRVLALGQALPEGLAFSADELGVKSITIRHMLSGEVQSIQLGIADGAEVLESLVRGFQEGIRMGAYTPRMACGWHACGDCEHRGLCFADSEQNVAFNPAIERQVQANQAMLKQVERLVRRDRRSAESSVPLKHFLSWMSENPELKAENALWLIEAVEAGSP